MAHHSEISQEQYTLIVNLMNQPISNPILYFLKAWISTKYHFVIIKIFHMMKISINSTFNISLIL